MNITSAHLLAPASLMWVRIRAASTSMSAVRHAHAAGDDNTSHVLSGKSRGKREHRLWLPLHR